MFELHYEPFIINDKLKAWKIAAVPWDTETFGFGVSVLSPFYDEVFTDKFTSLENALEAYSKSKQVRMITASIPAMQVEMSLLLQKAGFHLIDTALSVCYDNLHNFSENSSQRLSLAPVTSAEMSLLVDMAGVSFRHGRYHMDPRLPNTLADQRYKDWLDRCHKPDNPQQILTARFDGTICGFSVVEHKAAEGYLHLHTIDSKWRGKKLGQGMIIQSLRYLHNLGANCIDTKISASNLRALNMHARLHGRFITVERLLHWHRQER
jgi:RimJ/RimL family protein N-acetyltransferase